MHDIPPLYQEERTIVAVATPPGVGGIAVIRLSGKDAFSIGNNLFSKKILTQPANTVHYGWIKDLEENIIDEALVSLFKKPRSFTGEDVIEISCHGGSIIARQIVELLLQLGAVAAQPGEFTLRAFLNGKCDLTHAEAVQELISAKNEKALAASQQQLMGKLSKKIIDFRSRLTGCAAILEAWVDFPEEGVEFGTLEELCDTIEQVNNDIKLLIETYHNGKRVQEGVSLCLLGRPNVGKSSLLNALLDKEHAIVTEIPGTTRDLIEGDLYLNGLNLRLIDTAGIRQTGEVIEKEGIRRSWKAVEDADIVLLVLDASKGVTQEDEMLIARLHLPHTIIVWNKVDLPYQTVPDLGFANISSVSALKQEGIEDLMHTIDQLIWKEGPPDKGEVLITNLRHKESLENALNAFYNVVKGLKEELSPEFISFDMRDGLKALGSIIGFDITEEILSSIFSKFCIGK
jgi:tRNA modification GTPase